MNRRNYKNCIWAKVLADGITFQERSPKDLACYGCNESKLYKHCQAYEEIPIRLTKLQMITQKVREQNETIDLWVEERMLHNPNDYEDGVKLEVKE